MKLLHTGDWHIGKVVNEFSMLEDQRYLLQKLIEHMKEDRPDILIIAGDVYDRSVPPVGAVALLDEVLIEITDLGIPILAIAGNHDSGRRLSFASRLLEEKGLIIEGEFRTDVRVVTLRDAYGPVNFYLVPYEDPVVIKAMLGEAAPKNPLAAAGLFFKDLAESLPEDERNVLVTHGFFGRLGENSQVKAELSDSEVSVGGADLIDSSALQAFDYVALGHLHAPQQAGGEAIRYSGSLLKYSLSEAVQKKSFTQVELAEKGKTGITTFSIPPMRDLRVIRGTLEEVADKEAYRPGTNFEDYVFAELTDDEYLLDAMQRLRQVFPNTMGLKVLPKGREGSRTALVREAVRQKTTGELVEDFLALFSEEALSPEQKRVLEDVIRQAERQVQK